jgi:cytochrome c551/c552
MSYYENLISQQIDAGLYHEQEHLKTLNMINRITPDEIISLKDNEIIVFGSNSEGKHSKGAALFARKVCGAIYGQARGLQGQSYAIVTKKFWWKEKSSTLGEIQEEAQTFIEFAKAHEDLIFLVTRLGCSLAGYTVEEVAPLFKDAMDVQNIKLPIEFWDVLNLQNQ